MSLQPTYGLEYPGFVPHHLIVAGGMHTQFTIDASAEKVCCVLTVPKDGTIDTIGFTLGTVTTADTLKVSLQDVDAATGNPDGTADQYRTVASGSLSTNAWIETGLLTSDGTDGGGKRTVTRGQKIAVVIEFNSYVAGNLQIRHVNLSNGARSVPLSGFCYVTHYTTLWTRQNAVMPCVSLKYNDGTYGFIPYTAPYSNGSSSGIAVNTGGFDEIALKLNLPFKCKVSGAWFAILGLGDTDIVLYASDGSTVLATASHDKDLVVSSTPCSVGFTSEIELTAGTYYLSVKPTTTTSITVYYADVAAAAIFDQTPGGQLAHWAQRLDGGSWTNTLTRRPIAGLTISALDDGAGGGAAGHVQSRAFLGM